MTCADTVSDHSLSPVAGPSYWNPSSSQPGPSHVSQIGRGEDDPLLYTVDKVGESTFGNKVIDRHYNVTFDPTRTTEGKKLSSLQGALENMFDGVIIEAADGLQGSDLLRVVVHHNALTKPIYVPLRPLKEMSGNTIMEHVKNVLNSHEDIPLDQVLDLMWEQWNCLKVVQNIPYVSYLDPKIHSARNHQSLRV